MKRKIIFLLSLALPLFCVAQSSLAVEYDYDASGNRILRKVIDLQAAPPAPTMAVVQGSPEEKPAEPEYFVEKIAQVAMKIYPNPTTEKITLEIAGWEELQTGIFKLFSLSGQLLQEQQVHSTNTSISLAGLPKGIYLLQVQINTRTETWKVIKN